MTVNYAPNQAQCYVALPFGDLAGAEWRLADQIEGAVYDRDGGDLQNRGLYVDATPWQASVFTLTLGSSGACVIETRYFTFHSWMPADHSGCSVTSRRSALVVTGLKVTLL